ncbi:hypothetical protein GCM10028813_39780 [Ramlibacter alkalitolerans]
MAAPKQPASSRARIDHVIPASFGAVGPSSGAFWRQPPVQAARRNPEVPRPCGVPNAAPTEEDQLALAAPGQESAPIAGALPALKEIPCFDRS